MIAIVGIGETPPARRSTKDIRQLVLDACTDAIDDAGLQASDIDGLITDCGVMPSTVPQDWLAAQLGIELGFSAALSYGGAASAAAPLLAAEAIRSGRAKAVLFYFGVDWGSRPGGPYAFHDIYPAKALFEKPYGFNAQPTYFGMWARRYMHDYGLAADGLANIAIAQRTNARLNGKAQQTRPLDHDAYLASRIIADPLRVPDCCLISDGAGAYVMTSSERARDCRHVPISVLGAGFASSPITGDDVFTQPGPLLSTPAAPKASKAAQAAAGMTLAEIDFAEIYDCSTISCLLQIEDIGFCGKGEGAAFIKERGISIGGGLPINTHGGLLSYSYLLGIEHMIEAVRQLRGDSGDAQVFGARTGLVGGFSPPDYGVAILGRS
jgi:acetyl-CoA acetyltransferase